MDDYRQISGDLMVIAEFFQNMAVIKRDTDIDLSVKCFKACEIVRKLAGSLMPAEAEIEGGGSSWFYVCGECHGAISAKDSFCRHCGKPVEWK